MHTDVTPPSTPVLQASGLTKVFLGNPVLQDVDLDLRAGEVHGLVGENGAGKSTLMKILAGVHQPTSGRLTIDGRAVSFTHPVQAQQAGVSTVFQEFNLLPDRTVAENIYLGREPRRRGLVDTAGMQHASAELLDSLGVTRLGPSSLVRSLSVAEQQVVEIAKAMSYDARIITMDEPTAALADHEVELLYRIVHRLQERQVAILYVSHRLREVLALCDRVTVLKDGRLVERRESEDLDEHELVRLMVGRSVSTFFPPRSGQEPEPSGPERLVLERAGNGYVDDIDLTLRGGEIVGLAGLQGSGRTELVEAVFGVSPFSRGAMSVDGARVHVTSPRQAVRQRLALVTEDRKATGLTLEQSILDNVLGVVRAVFPHRTGPARAAVPGVLSSLSVSAQGLDQEVQFLSGGNQQKVVLARWLSIDPGVVLMDEPTRGIDVGAKHAVYELMRSLTAQGVAILMVSSELPEVLGMSDRILVMRDGRLAGELPAGTSEEDVLALATGADEGTALDAEVAS